MIKQLLFSSACLLAASSAEAFTEPTEIFRIENILAASDTVNLNVYAGTYKMEGMPFETIELKIEDGKLICYAGSYVLELKAGTETDKLESDQATFNFSRDEAKNIKGIHLEAQGMAFDGVKQ